MNVVDDRGVSIRAVGNGRRMPLCERCNNEINYDKINGANKRLKGEKSPRIDEAAAEYSKSGGECVLEC